LLGYSALASLGTAGFIGIGAYTTYYCLAEWGLTIGIAFIMSIAIALVIGIAVGYISLRIEGIYLVILTLALSEILRTLYAAIEPKLTLSSSDAVLFGVKFPRTSSLMLVSFFLVIVMIITTNLINSPTGRAMLAMKNSTAAAQAMGISLIKYRLMAFVICTAYASLTGVLLMMVIRSADATDPTGYYALITSLNILAAVIIGGYKSVWGAVVGTFIMYGIKLVVFNQIPFFAKNPLIITLVSGVLVIVIVMFYPGGLAQLLVELKGKLKVYKKKMKEAKYGKDLG
jgi:branched-chain amino acid transport system permease protein